MEGRPVDGAAEENDVGGEPEEAREQLERAVHRNGEPDASHEQENGEEDEAESRRERHLAGGGVGFHGETMSPGSKRSPEKGLKSF